MRWVNWKEKGQLRVIDCQEYLLVDRLVDVKMVSILSDCRMFWETTRNRTEWTETINL